ncbi:MAG: trehalose-6-phosphate synthase [Nitrospirae bacterium]|jgi:trehalose 6-phosphate synthase|nr:trehalose-6-phosphate synthase [Nitrospirota bacterium]
MSSGQRTAIRTIESIQSISRNLLGNAPVCIVTNREPIVYTENQDFKRPAGGVSQVLHALLERLGGVWIASRDSAGPATLMVPSGKGPGYLLERVNIPDSLKKPFYDGYSNGTLWPLFHGNRDQFFHDPGDFIQYDRVNQIFAKKVMDSFRKERPGIVWIHDYQLTRVAHWIRRESTENLPPLAFFCHIPWPNPADFMLLPEWQSVLEGILSHDIVGFQTPLHLDLFFKTVLTLLPEAEVLRENVVQWNGRQIKVVVMPVGIDPQHFRRMAGQTENIVAAKKFLENAGVPTEIPYVISVDRMDYTKGLFERLNILDRFFTIYPQWKEKISFVQIAVPTRSGQRTYKKYQEVLRERIKAFNQKWTTKDWLPLHSIETTLPQTHLSALYKMASGALITSTNDGMNLVAQEFLSCQGNGDGVLFLSCHTGSAFALQDALQIDPYHPVYSARQLNTGLSESFGKKVQRNKVLNRQIEQMNLYGWVFRLFENL